MFVTIDENAREKNRQQIGAEKEELEQANRRAAAGHVEDPDRKRYRGNTGGNSRNDLAQPDNKKPSETVRAVEGITRASHP